MITELLNQAKTDDVKWFINNVINKYKDDLTQGEAEHIVDYLNSDKAPKRLKKMSLDTARKKAEEWTTRLIKKAGKTIETEEDTETIKVWKNGLRLVKLVGENAFKREGHLMRHCVGSYYGKSGVTIYSIRDEQNNPHCTIELTGTDYIQQVKGKGNGLIHPRYIETVLKALKKIGVEIRESELRNLGYTSLSNELVVLIEKKFTGHKWLTFKNKRYFYSHSNLKEINND